MYIYIGLEAIWSITDGRTFRQAAPTWLVLTFASNYDCETEANPDMNIPTGAK